MIDNSDDRRVRKTKKALRQGLIVLMAQMPLKDISVRELTDFVDLHRGTFYVHYKDVFDLYAHIQSEIISEISQILDEYPAQNLNGTPFPMILALVNYFYHHSEICRMLISPNADQSFLELLSHLIHKKCIAEWSKIVRNFDHEKSEYYSEYVVSGCMGVLKKWTTQGMHGSPEQLSGLLEQMILQGAGFLG